MAIKSDQIALRTLTSDRLVLPMIGTLASNTSFDLTQTRTFSLYTAPLGKLGFVLGIFVQAVAATNVTIVPQINIGITSGEDDIFAIETLTDFTTTGDTWSNWLVMSKARLVKPGETAKLSVTAATADQLLSNIYLMGFEYSN